MRLNAYDTFEDEVATRMLAKRLQTEGMASMKQPHLWSTEPIRAIRSIKKMQKKVIATF